MIPCWNWSNFSRLQPVRPLCTYSRNKHVTYYFFFFVSHWKSTKVHELIEFHAEKEKTIENVSFNLIGIYIDQFIHENAKSQSITITRIHSIQLSLSFISGNLCSSYAHKYTLEMNDNVIKLNWISFALNIMCFYYIELLLCWRSLSSSVSVSTNGNQLFGFMMRNNIICVFVEFISLPDRNFPLAFLFVCVEKLATYFMITHFIDDCGDICTLIHPR